MYIFAVDTINLGRKSSVEILNGYFRLSAYKSKLRSATVQLLELN